MIYIYIYTHTYIHGKKISIKDIYHSKLILITYLTIDSAAGIGIFPNYTFF